MPGPSGMPDVMLSMFVVLAVAEEVESLNRKLYDSVVATLERAPAHAKTLIWPMGLAVRAQCALEMARSPVAELLGRVIDAALSAGGDGRGFKPWATLPLQAECRPPRPTLVASSHGATCARFGASSASATASTGQPACTAESAASAPDMPRNLSLSSAWAAVITMLARAAWWRSDGKMGSTCAAPATQPATPHKYRESAPSKSLLGSAVGTMLFCAVTLNFSVLSPEAALMQFDEVPFDTPVQSLVEASAALLGVAESDIGFLRDDNATINPLSVLSSLQVDGRIELRVVARDRVGGDAQFNADTAAASHPRHLGRRAAETQPDPVERPSRKPIQRWYCKASVEQEGTGKASGRWSAKYQDFTGPTAANVILQRDEWIHAFLHPKPRGSKTGERFAPSQEQREERPKRQATPGNMGERGSTGPSSEQARAGPGRGYTSEPSAPSALEVPVRIEQKKANANWLEQAAERKVRLQPLLLCTRGCTRRPPPHLLCTRGCTWRPPPHLSCTLDVHTAAPPALLCVMCHQAWQTSRIEQLERELACAHETIACRDATIEALRAKTSELTAALQMASEELMSNVETGGILKQAAHAQRLEEYPEWKEILGIGYSEPQRRVLMYKHLQKLLDLTRTVTGGDATKAKQLVDLLHARARAGENRVQSGMEKAREKNNRMNEGIMLSLSSFVHRLHDAGGKGRYPDKVRQAMQVVATSVSQAAMLARVPVKDVANALGLDQRLISKCKERFDALSNDGEWEALFDDRGEERSDQLDERCCAAVSHRPQCSLAARLSRLAACWQIYRACQAVLDGSGPWVCPRL